MGAAKGFEMVKAVERQQLVALLYFFEALRLYVGVGYDLAYAWGRALEGFRTLFPAPIYEVLHPSPGEAFPDCLVRLSREWPVAEHRIWFELLVFLYQQGTALGGNLERIAGRLRKENQLALENFGRRLPLVLNIKLLLFFFPAAMLLLMGPLLIMLQESFPG